MFSAMLVMENPFFSAKIVKQSSFLLESHYVNSLKFFLTWSVKSRSLGMSVPGDVWRHSVGGSVTVS